MGKNFVSWDDYVNETLKDEKEAVAYLEIALEEYHKDKDIKSLLCAVKRIAEAHKDL